MFGFGTAAKAKKLMIDDEQDDITRGITLKLGDNSLSLGSDGRWTNDRTDLDAAEDTILELLEANEAASYEITSLKKQLLHTQKEYETVNKLKNVMMDMLQSERQQNETLKQEVTGYQDELKRCYRMIIQLR